MGWYVRLLLKLEPLLWEYTVFDQRAELAVSSVLTWLNVHFNSGGDIYI